ncbi:penicillin-binding protein 2 [Humibacter sp.]|uniref:peptidoglycan D,D-transpeptidase FtsI family protein n=1 Tax=Humibacter sp. TaxID=1940291 RepID=UPI002C162AEC|nr:penicillin-binding protein 2 [Humibacter sp.]HVX06779.1 penicillin-binding protein 2 [Humibacter sp.]
MNKEIKRVSIVVLCMFLALFVSTSVIQVGVADTLNADARNSRTLYDSYQVQRGSILVAGQPVAQSVPSNDAYNYQRQYPQGPLYSSVTGFFPISGAPTGIEGAMNSELSGTSNDDFFDQLQNLVTGKHPQGNSVELTIDPVAQRAAYDALGSQKGAVVLLQPKTGRVLAMVSKPDFDPNTLAVHDVKQVDATYQQLLDAPGDPLINKSINELNPPGSTFKPVVLSAALESGDYTLDSQMPNPSSLTLPGTNTKIFNDSFTSCGPGDTVSLETALILSCNIPYAELAMKLGSSAIKAQAEKYGFNQSFLVPMRTSASQYPGYSSLADTAMSGFGQKDDKATALQMAMNSAAISTGGVVMRPNLVESVLTPDLQARESFKPTEFGRSTSEDTADKIAQTMVKDVSEGVASNARIDGVKVGGKTGTAQNGDKDPYTLWFTGFAPANDPQFAVAVVVDNGGGLGQSGNGNSVAAPIAKKVLEAVLGK